MSKVQPQAEVAELHNRNLEHARQIMWRAAQRSRLQQFDNIHIGASLRPVESESAS